MLPKLLQEIVDGLSELTTIEAVLLSGSRGKSATHDASSDFDLYVYSTEVISLEKRKLLLEPRSRLLELNNNFWETEDDGVLNDGTAYELIYRSIKDLDSHLKELLVNFRAQTGYSTCLWANLLNSSILFDRNGLAGELQGKYNIPYPQALQQAIVDKNWPLLMEKTPAYFHQVEKALKRDDWVSVQHRTAAFLASYFDILFAVNKIPHPGEKKLQAIAEKLPLLPQHFSQNIKALRSHSGSDNLWILSDLESLTQNLLSLLIQQELLVSTSMKVAPVKTKQTTHGEEKSPPLVVYTDGGCIGNPGKGAWAYIIVDGEEELEGSGGEALTTNNKMELQAVISALGELQSLKKTERGILIHTDSQYVKNGINEWIHTWERNGWKTAAKEPVKNKELWQKLQELQKALKPQWKWVKGHAGNPLNERCDRLVRKTMDAL